MPPSQKKAGEFGVRATFIFTKPSGEALAKIAEMADAQQLRPVVGIEISLENVRQAHESKGGSGKIIINVGKA